MRLFRMAQAMAFFCIVGILAGSTLAPVRGIARNFKIEIDASTSGSGSAGTGSIAVAAFFDSATSTGVGGFSGNLLQPVLGGLDQLGVFSLIVPAPLPFPVLPCGPAGEVGASGTITSGSFQGQLVVVFGCVGTHTTGGFQIIDRKSGSIILYAGEGFGNTSVSSSPILAGAVFAGNTLGAGSAGSGSLDLGGYGWVENSLPSGGAFVGTLSGPGPVGGTFGVIRFSITVGFFNDTVIISGMLTGGSFSGQPLTVSLTLTTSTSSGPQPVAVTIVIGSALKPIYAGHGSGLAAIAIPNLIEA